MFDALGLEDLVHGVGRGAERRVHVAAPVGRTREHVAVDLPGRVLIIVDRRDGVGQRPQRTVRDLDELGGLPGSLPRVGDGPGVVREPERSMKHDGNPDVVDIVTVAEREIDALVAGAPGPEAPRRDRLP